MRENAAPSEGVRGRCTAKVALGEVSGEATGEVSCDPGGILRIVIFHILHLRAGFYLIQFQPAEFFLIQQPGDFPDADGSGSQFFWG